MKIIDARGETCPVPVILMKKALKEAEGENIREIVDNEISRDNLEKMLRELGLSYTSFEEDGDFVVQVNRSDTDAGSLPLKNASDTVLVIESDTMGRGDDELGRILVKNFLYALTESDGLPGKIVLYNTGVRLATVNEDTAADLKKLEERGVGILVCGLCLNYFGLTEKLKAGSVSNMYAIVEAKLSAGKIINI
jgi:selenium metabolism protein YedF